MPTKKKTTAKTGKKSAAKSTKSQAKVAVEKPTVAVQPVTNSGVVTMKPVEDEGAATEGNSVSVKPSLDKETGVITMVPQE